MTARDDLLQAAAALTENGTVAFSPAQLIAAARQRGSNYPDATLRSMIVDHLRVDEGRTKTGFERVGRGLYRWVTDEPEGDGVPEPKTPRLASTLTPAPPSASPTDADWRWEGNVQAALVRWLAASGWDILRVADTASREHGVDIEARRGGYQLVVEVKGYPSKTYRGGPRQGEAKSFGAGAQARTYFSNAVLAGIVPRGVV